jgi:hypothetical protein
MDSLDKDVVNLTKAIRQVESGGKFDARSKDGSYGAYQFIKPTWDATAKKYGVNAEWEKATPQQQNEVAYKQIKEWKDKGYNVGQIASMWNAGAGRPNAYKEGLSGTNKDGVAYNVSKYAEKVATNYQKIKGATMEVPPATQQPTEQPEDKSLLRKAGDFFTSSTQKFGKTIGDSLAAGENTERYSQALGQNTEIANNLKLKIAENKKLGQDTSRLESALAQLEQGAPTQEQFTGDVINKTTGQVLGEAGGTILEATSGGLLSSGAKTAISPTLSTLGKVKEGAKIGAIYGGAGGGTSAMQEGAGVTDTLKSAGVGSLIGATLGGGLAFGGVKLGEKLASRPAQVATQKAEQASKVTGEILQGTPDDIMRGQKVLQNPKLKDAKTYKEGLDVLDSEITNLSKKQDKTLSKDTTLRKLKDLNATLKVGDKTIKHNYVNDALDQIDEFYKKTNNQVGRAEIAQLRAKATKQGLTTKEINDLAKLHGQKLNAFNASGELASGLTKQGAENTRAGLKTTVRELFGGKASQRIDKQISDTIRVRDLFQTMTEKVNTLQQKIQERSLGAKAGYLIGKVINTLGLGSPKGIVEAMIPRGQGFKVMNALDLEKNLQKNLQILQDAADKSIPESTLIKKLESFLQTMTKDVSYPSLAQRPAQSITTNKISQNIAKPIPKIESKVNLPETPNLNISIPKEIGSEDIRKVMDGLSLGYSKENVIKIMQELYANNPSGKFTPREVSLVARKYKSKPTLKLK